MLNALIGDGYYYERYPDHDGEYGLTWFTRPTFDGLIAEVAPELQAVAYHPLDLEGHQDVAVFRKVAKRPSRHADERAQNVRAPEHAEAAAARPQLVSSKTREKRLAHTDANLIGSACWPVRRRPRCKLKNNWLNAASGNVSASR